LQANSYLGLQSVYGAASAFPGPWFTVPAFQSYRGIGRIRHYGKTF